MIPQIFYSNRLEVLLDLLFQKLFESQYSTEDPLFIALPSEASQRWVLESWVKRGGAPLGLRWLLPHELIPHLYAALFERHAPLFPSKAELALLIEESLVKAPASFQEIVANVRHDPLPLSLHLAELFQEWSLEGNGPEWLVEFFFSVCESWKITPLLKAVKEAPERGKKPEVQVKVHLFALERLPLALRLLLQKSGVDASLYILSPCALFFADLRTDRERQGLQQYWGRRGVPLQERLALEEFFEQGNWLLANWGKKDRLLLELLEETEWPSSSHYLAPKGILSTPLAESLSPEIVLEEVVSLSSLKLLQNEILLLHPFTDKPKDHTLKISHFTSLWEEVEGLRDAVGEALAKGIAPKEILILTPAISKVAPFIKVLFGSSHYRIEDCKFQEESPLLEALCLAVEGPLERPSSSNWLRFLHHPGFAKHSLFEGSFALHALSEEAKAIFSEVKGVLLTLRSHYPLPVEEWVTRLKEFCSRFLIEEERALAFLWEQLDYFAQSITRWSRAPLRFDQVWHFLNALLGQEEAIFQDEVLEGIRIASLLPGRLQPVRALFLLQMTEEDFPRTAIKPRLTKGVQSNPFHEDLSLFLHACLTPKELLWISYHGQKPSVVIKDLEYALGCKEERPLQPQQESQLLPLLTFEPPRLPHTLPTTIHLSSLLQAVGHPLRFYLQKMQQIAFPPEFEEFEEMRAIDHFLAKKAYLDGLEREVVGASPLFKEASALRRAEEIRAVEEQLAHFQLKRDELFTVKAQKATISWRGQEVTIVGDIGPHSNKGRISLREYGLEELLREWPALLLAQSCGLPEGCIFLPSKERVLLKEQSWSLLLDFFAIVSQQPCPLHPDWLRPVAERNVEKTDRRIKERLTPFIGEPDVALLWTRSEWSAERIIEEWHGVAKELYEGF